MRRAPLVLLLAASLGVLAPGGTDERKEGERKDAPAGKAEHPANARIKKILAEKRLSFDFVRTPLGDALGFLRGVLEVNLVVAPAVDRTTPVTLKARDMKAGHALGWVAELAGARVSVEEGAVFVAPAEPKKPPKAPDKADPDTREVKKRLKGKTLSFDFVETPLADVVAFMQSLLGVTIILDPAIPPDLPVTLRLEKVRAGSALHWIAKLAGAKTEIRHGAAFLRNVRKRTPKAKPKVKPEGGEL